MVCWKSRAMWLANPETVSWFNGLSCGATAPRFYCITRNSTSFHKKNNTFYQWNCNWCNVYNGPGISCSPWFPLDLFTVEKGKGSKLITFHGNLPYSSGEIIKKLELLDEEDVVGSGGFGAVYKMVMDDNSVYAVKRIDWNCDGSDQIFERELEILGSVKHINLVNLRGYCRLPSAKFLIYDYLTLGSLDHYLHEYLLNGHATEKSDVYSFGVLLLELVTAKRPTDPSFVKRGLNVVGWLNTLTGEHRLEEIVDEKCGYVDDEAVEAILGIAAMCTDANPDDRSSMNGVLKMLEEDYVTLPV